MGRSCQTSIQTSVRGFPELNSNKVLLNSNRTKQFGRSIHKNRFRLNMLAIDINVINL